jgi:hypothetical protein
MTTWWAGCRRLDELGIANNTIVVYGTTMARRREPGPTVDDAVHGEKDDWEGGFQFR